MSGPGLHFLPLLQLSEMFLKHISSVLTYDKIIQESRKRHLIKKNQCRDQSTWALQSREEMWQERQQKPPGLPFLEEESDLYRYTNHPPDRPRKVTHHTQNPKKLHHQLDLHPTRSQEEAEVPAKILFPATLISQRQCSQLCARGKGWGPEEVGGG